MICRDAVVVTVINCATSFLGGFVIFSVLGFMSLKSGIPVSHVATDGLYIVVPRDRDIDIRLKYICLIIDWDPAICSVSCRRILVLSLLSFLVS